MTARALSRRRGAAARRGLSPCRQERPVSVGTWWHGRSRSPADPNCALCVVRPAPERGRGNGPRSLDFRDSAACRHRCHVDWRVGRDASEATAGIHQRELCAVASGRVPVAHRAHVDKAGRLRPHCLRLLSDAEFQGRTRMARQDIRDHFKLTALSGAERHAGRSAAARRCSGHGNVQTSQEGPPTGPYSFHDCLTSNGPAA